MEREMKKKIMILFTLVSAACGKSGSKEPDSIEIPIVDIPDGEPEDDTVESPNVFEDEFHYYNLDLDDGGIGVNKAYQNYPELLDSPDVIVAVIDSGVDIYHEDLESQIWVNNREIPDNGIDDDGNGYVDDIHGWNYLADFDGNTITEESYEVTREYARLLAMDLQGTLPTELMQYYTQVKETWEEESKDIDYSLSFLYDINHHPRQDDLSDFSPFHEAPYGSPDVIGNPYHGTHVSGVLAANRVNNLGIKGVASNARIMPLVVVPDEGDEHDKDVFHAVYYAVDNGAKVINMSFSKAFSPYADKVNEAINYAQSRGVIVVHAAGNKALDLDMNANYPEAQSANRDLSFEIGASSSRLFSKSFQYAFFSNYGKNSVDLFAPGYFILSTRPENGYFVGSGTSISAPIVSGVAAMLLGKFPEASPEKICQAIRLSVFTFPEAVSEVSGTNEDEGVVQLPFSELSIYGGIINPVGAIEYLLNL